MSQKLRSFVCPSCNAPLKTDGEDAAIECQFCHTLVQVPQTTPHVVVIQQHINEPSRPSRPTPSGKLSAIYAGIVALVIVGTAIWGCVQKTRHSKWPSSYNAHSSNGFSFSGGNYSIERSLFLQNDAAQKPSRVFVLQTHHSYASDNTEETRPVCLEVATNKVLWTGPAIPQTKSYTSMFFATTDEHSVYLIVKNKLMALKQTDGSLSWETSLQDEPAFDKKHAFSVFGDKLLVLTKDGSLQGFSTRDGRPVWTVRFSETPNRLYVLATSVVVIDKDKDKKVLKQIDPMQGNVLAIDRPLGPPTKPFGFLEGVEYLKDMIAVPEENALYLAFGHYKPFNVQKWDLTTHKATWQSTLWQTEGLWYDLGETGGMVTTEQSLVFVAGKTIVVVDRKTGEVHSFQNFVDDMKDYNISLSQAQANILVIHAVRKKGTDRQEIWGIDVNTGKRLWQHIFDALKPSAHTSLLHDNDWVTEATPHHLHMFAFYPADKSIDYNRFDLKTGSSLAHKMLKTPELDSFSQVLQLNEEGLWLITGKGLYKISLESSETDFSWIPGS